MQTYSARRVSELGINLVVVAKELPDPGVYKCDCGWQLLETVMGVPFGENASISRGLLIRGIYFISVLSNDIESVSS